MSPHDILQYTRRAPFRPFRMTLTDGRTYDVRHPEMAMVGLSSVVVGLPGEKLEEPVEHRVDVSLNHIMQLEPIDAAQPN